VDNTDAASRNWTGAFARRQSTGAALRLGPAMADPSVRASSVETAADPAGSAGRIPLLLHRLGPDRLQAAELRFQSKSRQRKTHRRRSPATRVKGCGVLTLRARTSCRKYLLSCCRLLRVHER
jgi:hypothetical protein